MVNTRDLCRQQWHWRQFGFEGNAELESFFKPKFRISQCFFIVYRAFVAVYVLAWNIALHATWRENAAHSSFYYLSNWIYLLLAIYLIYAFIVTLSYAARPEKQDTTAQRTLDVLPLVPRRQRHRKEKRPQAEGAENGRENRSPERRTSHKSHKIRRHREQIKLRMRHSKNYETRSTKTDASDPLLPENEEEAHVEKRSKRASRFLHSGSLLLLPQKAGKSKRSRRAAQKDSRRENENKQTERDQGKKEDPQNEINKQSKSVDETRGKKPSKPLTNGQALPQTKTKPIDNRASTSTSGPSGSNLPHPKDNDNNRAKTKKKNTPRNNEESPQTVNKGTQTRPEDIKKSMRLTPNQGGDALTSTPKPTPPSVAIKVFWIFHSTACNLSVVITLMVYMVMYPYLGALSALIQVDAITLNCHGINSLIVLIDLMLSSVPVRILHFVYPAILGILYVVFSLVYWSLDKYFNVLYIGILDWNDPGIASGISALLIFVIVPLIQLFLFGLSLLRDLIHDCCTKSRPSVRTVPPHEPEDSMA